MQQHSTPGAIMGTVGYMSPEQAQGKTKEIDHRSDIFSFGCILFEAVTGKKPFEGESVIKSLHKVVYEPVPLLAAAIEAIRRAIELDPFMAIYNAAFGWWLYLSRRYEEAVEQSLKTIEIAPNHFFAHWVPS